MAEPGHNWPVLKPYQYKKGREKTGGRKKGSVDELKYVKKLLKVKVKGDDPTADEPTGTITAKQALILWKFRKGLICGDDDAIEWILSKVRKDKGPGKVKPEDNSILAALKDIEVAPEPRSNGNGRNGSAKHETETSIKDTIEGL